MGASPMTGPTPNKGYEAAAMQGVGVVLNKLAELLPMAGPATDIGKAISRAIDSLAKVVPPGSVSNAQERNTIDGMARKNMQNQQMQKQLSGGGGMPPAGGQGAAPPMAA